MDIVGGWEGSDELSGCGTLERSDQVRFTKMDVVSL